MAPTFSIIIPVYNVAPYLAECLDSVRAQTYADWEALCVDDGSTDTSSTLLDTYARLDPRIHITHQRNAGVSSARNRALDIAHGDWIWFVDGDDAIHPQALGHINEVIQKEGTNVEAIGIKHIDGSRLPTRWGTLNIKYNRCSVATMQSLWHFWGAAWRTLFSRQFIVNQRFGNYRMGEDLLFSITCFVEMKCWILADIPCYFYRSREGSAMRSQPRVEVVQDWLDVQKNLHCLLWDTDFLCRLEGDKDLFLRRWGGWLYYTVNEMLFKLSLSNMKLCYNQWMDNLIRFGSRSQWPLHKRLPIMVVRQVRVLWLMRVIIYWPLLIRRKLLHM